MQCMLGPAQKSIAMHKMPLLWLFYSSEDYTSLRVATLIAGEHQRLREKIIGHGEWASAASQSISH